MSSSKDKAWNRKESLASTDEEPKRKYRRDKEGLS